MGIAVKSSSLATLYIYAGPGTCSVAIKHTNYTLKQLSHTKYNIQTINPEEVIQGRWINDAALFIMPGGADILYTRSLKAKGNQQIQTFVQGGGRYLGFCAGAYYSSKSIVFAPGTPLGVAANRELAFFPDIVEGPTLKPWDHKSNSGSEAAPLQWKESNSTFAKGHNFTIYYNGGGHFVNANAYPQVTILADYVTTPSPKAANVDITVGNGRVILSGVHCEFAPELFDMTDPFLVPIQQKLMNKDGDRRALMTHLLDRLGIETKLTHT